MSHESKCRYIVQKAMDLVQAEKEDRDVHCNLRLVKIYINFFLLEKQEICWIKQNEIYGCM
jgi:hypothetical protein